MSARRLNNRAAAAYLGLSPDYLRLLRKKGGGPVYEKGPERNARVAYAEADLDRWRAERRRLRRATCEPGREISAGA